MIDPAIGAPTLLPTDLKTAFIDVASPMTRGSTERTSMFCAATKSMAMPSDITAL